MGKLFFLDPKGANEDPGVAVFNALLVLHALVSGENAAAAELSEEEDEGEEKEGKSGSESSASSMRLPL